MCVRVPRFAEMFCPSRTVESPNHVTDRIKGLRGTCGPQVADPCFRLCVQHEQKLNVLNCVIMHTDGQIECRPRQRKKGDRKSEGGVSPVEPGTLRVYTATLFVWLRSKRMQRAAQWRVQGLDGRGSIPDGVFFSSLGQFLPGIKWPERGGGFEVVICATPLPNLIDLWGRKNSWA